MFTAGFLVAMVSNGKHSLRFLKNRNITNMFQIYMCTVYHHMVQIKTKYKKPLIWHME